MRARQVLLTGLTILVLSETIHAATTSAYPFLFDNLAMIQEYPSPYLWQNYPGLDKNAKASSLTTGLLNSPSGSTLDMGRLYLAGMHKGKRVSSGVFVHSMRFDDFENNLETDDRVSIDGSHSSSLSAVGIIIPDSAKSLRGISLSIQEYHGDNTYRRIQQLYDGTTDTSDNFVTRTTIAAKVTATVKRSGRTIFIPSLSAAVFRNDTLMESSELPFAVSGQLKFIRIVTPRASFFCSAEAGVHYDTAIRAYGAGSDTMTMAHLAFDATLSNRFGNDKFSLYAGISTFVQSYEAQSEPIYRSSSRKSGVNLTTPLVLSWHPISSAQVLFAMTPTLAISQSEDNFSTYSTMVSQKNRSSKLTCILSKPTFIITPTQNIRISFIPDFSDLRYSSLEISGQFSRR